MNRYLEDRASRRSMMRDGRNPYGSRGGYVSSRRSRRGRDRAMDGRNDYTEYDSGYDSGYNSRDRGQDYHYPMEHYGEHHRPMGYEMYGVGGIMPMNDYNYDMNDYGYDMARGNRGTRGRGRRRDYGYDMNDYGYEYDYDMRDYEHEDKKWKEHLKKWCEDLKRHDRFNMPKDQVLHSAKQMGVKFEHYNEEEFMTTYYMIISDYDNQLIPSPQEAILFAKEWLEDKDSKLKGSEKLCAYYYEVVKGGEEE